MAQVVWMTPRTDSSPPADAGQPPGDRSAGASAQTTEQDWRDSRCCAAGDHEACARLFRRHEAAVARQVGRFSRDRQVREELAQEVFTEAYFALPRYRPGPAPFAHWLARIATRVGYRFWKRQARRRRHLSLSETDIPAPAPPADASNPVVAAALLHALLGRLAPADRLVLTLQYFEACDMRQITERTGWNVAVVKMRAWRARGRLKALIEREGLLDQLRGAGDGNA
jgi:RNA polymerase sigma-70 factor (ECF subfamily)